MRNALLRQLTVKYGFTVGSLCGGAGCALVLQNPLDTHKLLNKLLVWGGGGFLIIACCKVDFSTRGSFQRGPAELQSKSTLTNKC